MKDNRVSDGICSSWIETRASSETKSLMVSRSLASVSDGSVDVWHKFLNILKGDISLVGTRPPTLDEWEKYKYHHRARLATRRGLTGMWQVSGWSKITDFVEVVKMDTEYIDHWSIGLDIRILLKTVKVVFTKDGVM